MLYFEDAYRERKKLLQHELHALEKEAEARCVVLVSCNCSILILLLSYFSARIYRHWVFLHPFILLMLIVLITTGIPGSKQLLIKLQPPAKAGIM